MKPASLIPAELRRPTSAEGWHLLVDLSLLRPAGENGGIKQFIFEYLAWIGHYEGQRLTITYLTWTCSHSDVRKLVRPQDRMLCVRIADRPGTEVVGDWREREWICVDPPPHLAVEIGADLIYSPQGSPEFFCPGIPCIATIVDLLHRDYPMTLSPAGVAQREKLFADLVRYTDAFQCISDFTAKQLRTYFDVPAARTFRTYIAVQERLTASPADLAEFRDTERPYFLYPANAWAHKNHLTLLVAYRLYRSIEGDRAWNLELTGHTDAAMQEVLDYAKALGIGDAVSYHGHLEESQFQSVWRNASALVFPSLHEGFGIPLVEAMHLGIPIVCSSETSLPEVAGDAALLVDARDPSALAEGMRQISADAVVRTQLITRGKERASFFAIEREAKAFLDECARLRSGRTIEGTRGIHPDGWTDPVACIAVPGGPGDQEFELTITAMPCPRRVRIYHDRHALGGFPIAANSPCTIKVAPTKNCGTIVLEIPDAANLCADDHRTHGIWLRHAAFRSKTFPTTDTVVFSR